MNRSPFTNLGLIRICGPQHICWPIRQTSSSSQLIAISTRGLDVPTATD